jgi:hypothetical protein
MPPLQAHDLQGDEVSEPLDDYYREACEYAREIVTLIKVAEQHGTDDDGHVIRGQIRQKVNGSTPLQTWLLVEVLARAVAATYDDLDDWSAAVIQALSTQEDA